MPELFRPLVTRRLPTGAEVADRDGKPHVRVTVAGVTRWHPLTTCGTKYYAPGPRWAADVVLADGRRKRERFASNKQAAAAMLADLLKRIELDRSGVVDRFSEHRRRPLTDHRAAWEQSLTVAGRPAEYVAQKVGRVRAAMEGCKFVFTADLNAEALANYLHRLRTVGVFTGEGKPREKLSVGTTNDHLQAFRQFVRWMLASGRIDTDPFTLLKPGNAEVHATFRRGELSYAERAKLLDTAAASPETYRGLTGPDRRMLYLTALGTGFRVSELADLTPASFNLAADTPVAILGAGTTKNETAATQPLAKALADELRPYLAGKPAGVPVWPGTWSDRGAAMLARDLEAAGVAVIVEGPEGDETRDFHALRNCYISDVLRTGADLKQAMTLARHSDPKLTAKRYGRVRMHDLGSVVNKLPGGPTAAGPERQVLRMTGTDATKPLARAQQNAQQNPAPSGLGW